MIITITLLVLTFFVFTSTLYLATVLFLSHIDEEAEEFNNMADYVMRIVTHLSIVVASGAQGEILWYYGIIRYLRSMWDLLASFISNLLSLAICNAILNNLTVCFG
jgi:hypothetical protein